MSGTVRVGTAGWHYDHWKGPFYPEELPASRMLAFYAERFAATEINSFFYGLPKAETVAGWRDAVPGDFRFAVKASRYITHMKKLKDPADSVARFHEAAAVLGDHLGPVLFQLPPKWRANPQRLDAFLAGLPTDLSPVLEFRDPSWFDTAVTAVLERHGAAFCIYDLAGEQSPLTVTADRVYIRLHGPSGTAYHGSYSDAALAAWAERIQGWRDAGRDVYCFFDNDEAGYAALDAQRLQGMLGTD